MLLNYNECKIINIVWIERGILITIIYYILKKYIMLLNKIIIIDNIKYCKFLKIIFPKLKFNIFNKHNDNNFYFNIRKIIRNQDIIIDYLANYSKIINTKKISLLPWYDMNDPIIIYQFNSKNKIKIKKYKYFIINFSQCKRGNYYNKIWDAFIESTILYKYVKFNKNINFHYLFNMINNFLKSTYAYTIERPKIYYINNQLPILDNYIQQPTQEGINQYTQQSTQQSTQEGINQYMQQPTQERIYQPIFDKSTQKGIIETTFDKSISSHIQRYIPDSLQPIKRGIHNSSHKPMLYSDVRQSALQSSLGHIQESTQHDINETILSPILYRDRHTQQSAQPPRPENIQEEYVHLEVCPLELKSKESEIIEMKKIILGKELSNTIASHNINKDLIIQKIKACKEYIEVLQKLLIKTDVKKDEIRLRIKKFEDEVQILTDSL